VAVIGGRVIGPDRAPAQSAPEAQMDQEWPCRPFRHTNGPAWSVIHLQVGIIRIRRLSLLAGRRRADAGLAWRVQGGEPPSGGPA
jgi:hypothetical protein